MNRYFFHIRDGDGLVLDEDGCELPNLAAAKMEALQSAGDLLRQAKRNRIFTSETPHIEVRDDAGDQLVTQPVHHSWWQRIRRR